LNFYLDASFVVSLFVRDAHTHKADRWIEKAAGSIVLSDFCAVEFAAVMSRSARAGRLSQAEAHAVIADFDAWRSQVATSHYLGSADMTLADKLVRDFATKLAAADALHLAAAMNAGASLVTFDDRLAEAAAMQGVGIARLEP
jgi:predicted nucleic acid-binding protein